MGNGKMELVPRRAARIGALNMKPVVAEQDRANMQQESVVLLVGVGADETHTITGVLRASGAGPLSSARVVRIDKDHLGLTLGEALALEEGRAEGIEVVDSQRIMLVFGAAAIDEEGHEVFLEEMDEQDNPILLVPAVRNPAIVVEDMVEQLLADHDAAWQLNVPLETSPTCSWDPFSVSVAMNLELDGAYVKTRVCGVESDEERWDTGRVCVLDNFFGEKERVELLQQITAPDFNVSAPPPDAKWERSLSDQPGLPQTLGLKCDVLHDLCEMPSRAVLEIQSRLTRLYPEYIVSRMPEAVLGDEFTPLVANAPITGDHFSWHIDADPNMLPPSPWRDRHGPYINREPAKPLFVSALLYLNPDWPEEWDAETLFLGMSHRYQLSVSLVRRLARRRLGALCCTIGPAIKVV